MPGTHCHGAFVTVPAMPSFRRFPLPALLTTAGLAVAGCGGGGGGDEDAYVRSYESACKNIVTATKDLQKTVSEVRSSSGSDPKEAFSALKGATTTFLDEVGREIPRLAQAEAPDKFSDFQDSVKENEDEATKGIDQAKREVEKTRTLQDLSNLDEVFDKIDVGTSEDLPKELADKAPSCKTLENSGS
jgi:hypothetical protein